MITVVLILVLAGALSLGWLCWPSITAGRAEANRYRQIDQLRHRTLRDLDYLAERARRDRSLADTQRIDRIVSEHDL